MRKYKILFYPYQVYKYLIVYPCLGLLTFLSAVTLGFAATFLPASITIKIGHKVGIIWARGNSIVTPSFVKVVGKENVDKNQSYVVVSNHQSQYDIYVIYGWLPVNFIWVMKMELRRVPALGYACYKMGHIFVDRKNKGGALKSLDSAKDIIKNGTSIMFFPEGTRSDGTGLMKFKKGAFKFAIDIGLPILPVTITGTDKILPNNSMGLFPGNSKLSIHKPVQTNDFNEDNIEVLIEKVRGTIQKGLNEN